VSSVRRVGGLTMVRATEAVTAPAKTPPVAVGPAHGFTLPKRRDPARRPQADPPAPSGSDRKFLIYSHRMTGEPHEETPREFEFALESIERANTRDDLVVRSVRSPDGLAPWSVALAAEVDSASHGSDTELGAGRFVLLYDPSEPDAWGGVFRVVCFAQAPLEPEIGVDPFLADVAWSWLTDALDERVADYTAASGTATKIISTGFGELAEQGDGAKIEVRASWTPLEADISAHVEAWVELVSMLAGLPPVAEGVTLLSARRAGRA
jgi:hypothetical protein